MLGRLRALGGGVVALLVGCAAEAPPNRDAPPAPSEATPPAAPAAPAPQLVAPPQLEALHVAALPGGDQVGVYRAITDPRRCPEGPSEACDVQLRRHAPDGSVRWARSIAQLVTAGPEHRFTLVASADAGSLWLLEPCGAAAAERCGALLAFSSEAGELRWQTAPGSAAGPVLPLPGYVAFAGRADAPPALLQLLRERDGTPAASAALAAPVTALERHGELLHVTTEGSATPRRYRLPRAGALQPRLVALDRTPPPGNCRASGDRCAPVRHPTASNTDPNDPWYVDPKR